MAPATLTLGSQNRWLADGSTTIWNFNFVGGYLASDTVLAYSFLTDESIRIDHTLEFLSEFQVRITPAVADGRTLVIYRDSSNGGLPRADFTDGGGITESNLDLMAKQSVFVSEEVRDFIGITTEADLASALLATSNNAAAAAVSAASANVSADIATVAAASSQAYAALASTHRTAAEIAAANAAGEVDALEVKLAGTGSGQGAGQIGVHDAAALLIATTVEAALAEIATRVYGDVTFVATGGDDSTALQTLIDANKGKRITVRGDCTFAGVTLNGATYNGTRLDIQSHKLSVRPTSGTNTFGGAYVGLLFKDCDACELTYRGDGQRALQPDEQHIYLVGLAGVSNLHIVKFHCRELRGDGLYVSQSTWTSNSTTTTNLVIDDIKGYNSADDGRNLLSLIAYDGVTIGSFQSIAIGGVVGGVRMPGGLDVEPNFAYQTCNSLTIGSAVVRSQGTTCFGVQGKDAGSEAYCVTGFSCGSLDSINTLGTSATTGTWAFNFYQATDVQITGRVGHTVNTHGLTGRIDACIGVQAKLKVSKSFAGIALGESGWVRKSHIDINITDYAGAAAGYGVRLVGLSDCRVTGHVSGAQNASSTFAVQFRNNLRAITQTNNRISIDAPKDTNNARGYRNETADLMVFSNCQISDCNVTGYGSWNAGMDGFGVAGIRKVRIFGWTVVSSQPSDGGWTQGDFVEKTNPTKDASNMAVYGWVRITTGTGAVSGTDWSIANVSHVSPAT